MPAAKKHAAPPAHLVRWRWEARMSIREVAALAKKKKIGCSVSHLYNVERGRDRVTEELAKLYESLPKRRA